jgi:ribose transport system permease protein
MSAPAANAPPPAVESDPRAVHASPMRTLLTHSATLVFVVNLLLIAFFVALSPNHVFWSGANAESLLRNGAEILLLALGVALLMGAGVFDLSVGANLVLAW